MLDFAMDMTEESSYLTKFQLKAVEKYKQKKQDYWHDGFSHTIIDEHSSYHVHYN